MKQLFYCHCAALRTGHWHVVTAAGCTIPAPIRSREFLDKVLAHLKEKGVNVTVTREQRREIKTTELTRWERNHLSPRALHSLCRVSGE